VKRRLLYAIPLLAAIALAAGLGGLMLNTDQAGQNQMADPAIEIIPILRVYKDGNLVYEKEGDPPTNNLALLFYAAIAPAAKTDGSANVITITAMDGSANALDPDNAYGAVKGHKLWAVVGTGTTPAGPSDYSMQTVGYGEAKLVSLYYDDNATAWHMVVTAAVTLSTGANITEVGLAADALSNTIYDPANGPAYNALLFRDLLPQPIAAQAGDVIEVQYEIIIDLP